MVSTYVRVSAVNDGAPITGLSSTSTNGCQRNSPYETRPSQCATGVVSALPIGPGGANATGSTTITEMARNNTIRVANCPGVGSSRPRGPASGVDAMTNSPAASAQQVSGA